MEYGSQKGMCILEKECECARRKGPAMTYSRLHSVFAGTPACLPQSYSGEFKCDSERRNMVKRGGALSKAATCQDVHVRGYFRLPEYMNIFAVCFVGTSACQDVFGGACLLASCQPGYMLPRRFSELAGKIARNAVRGGNAARFGGCVSIKPRRARRQTRVASADIDRR
ncbi:hypothetical protein C8R44DRAFT_846662 [Mycena epipterygia]|nr:hypothetical protein C8R44DRAFT_846662 [Mycena epipterygia]